MSNLFQRLWKRFENTFHPAHASAGLCSAYSASQVKDLLEHGASLTKKARTAAAFAKYSDVLGDAGDKLENAADKVNSLVSKGKSIAVDVDAACRISNAVAVLNRWSTSGSGVSAQDAAKAFDELFGGAADFFGKLPPPVNAYAQVLAEIAKNNFFSRMQDIMDPESPNTPRGRQLREIMNSM